GEVVDLPETSVTLELLFQFMYPQRHPGLDTTPFKVLGPLAEAAEKYQIFPAMNICHIRVRDLVHDHPVAVAVYATKHDYPYLVSEVASMMISMPVLDVIEMLPPYLVMLPPSTQSPTCTPAAVPGWPLIALAPMFCLGAGIQTLRSLDKVFNVSAFQRTNTTYHSSNSILVACCKENLAAWRQRIEDAIAVIPKFSTFL
ncbi:hypothetical protein B0H13DRAFT_1666207, partial [Mycena leptocephala]